jgi:hypothetical protein
MKRSKSAASTLPAARSRAAKSSNRQRNKANFAAAAASQSIEGAPSSASRPLGAQAVIRSAVKVTDGSAYSGLRNSRLDGE